MSTQTDTAALPQTGVSRRLALPPITPDEQPEAIAQRGRLAAWAATEARQAARETAEAAEADLEAALLTQKSAAHSAAATRVVAGLRCRVTRLSHHIDRSSRVSTPTEGTQRPARNRRGYV
jgi:hypothetical protein